MIFRFLPKLLLIITFIAFFNLDDVIATCKPSAIGGQRSTIGDVELKFVIVVDDNGDRVGDSALLVNGLSAIAGQGVQYILQSKMTVGETLNLTTSTYNPNSSGVQYNIQLVNNTDDAVLSTEEVLIVGSSLTPVQTTLTYVTTQQDVEDQLVLRYVRTDDGHIARDFAIDNITLNGNVFSLDDKSASSAGGHWSVIGDVELRPVTDDGNNGDRVGDGALLVNGLSTATGQGVQYVLQSKMVVGETLNVTTVTYNPPTRTSAVEYNIQLINNTDNVLLSDEQESIAGYSQNPVYTELTYMTTPQDRGDELILRYVRTDDGHFARDFAIDRIMLNGRTVSMPCVRSVVPDLPLIPSSDAIEKHITDIVQRFSDDFDSLPAQPGSKELEEAEEAYKELDISTSGYSITGNTITNIDSLKFVKDFASELKYNPDNLEIKQMLNNTVWLFGQQVCDGTISVKKLYSFRDFARPVSLSRDHISPNVRELFKYAVHKFTRESAHLWGPYVVHNHHPWGGIDTDVILINADTMLAMAAWEDTPEERLRYIRAYKRYLERFVAYSPGKADGIKPDGAGFHHWSAYNAYMNAYSAYADVLFYLRDTPFQIDEESYRNFRDAVYYQYLQSDDNAKTQPLSTAGRSPQARYVRISSLALKRTALAGGPILGEGKSDSALAQLYNRIYGSDTELDEPETADFVNGFTQYNYASAGGYRHDNWLAFSKGFTKGLWGTETYTNSNRFGRYQSYGALEILYPGNMEKNGYDPKTWNWNYNPGATTIRLPWSHLHAERERIDEYQSRSFVGALAFDRAPYARMPLEHTTGTSGLFAMDFQECEDAPKWGKDYTNDKSTHNDSFTFRKSAFFFDDMIINLATGISNDDNDNPTITTLFQRLDNEKSIIANGQQLSITVSETFSGGRDNWFLSNYGTGFYVVGGNSSDVSIRHEAKVTPYFNQTIEVDFSSNQTATHYIGYIDHGKAPSNATYEYIIKPNTDSARMEALAAAIQNGKKSYTVQRKDDTAHIVSYDKTDTWGYAIFSPTINMTASYVHSVDKPALLMHRYNSVDGQLLLSIANPNLEMPNEISFIASPTRTVEVKLNGFWTLADDYPNVKIISGTLTETTLRFQLRDGLPNEIRLVESTREGCSTVIASAHDGNLPINTLDGDLNTRWSGRGDGQYIQYCLAEPVTLSCLDMAFLEGDIRKATFDIEISSDGTNWTRVLNNATSSGNTLDLEQFSFDPIVAKKIRFVGHGNSDNTWNSITEVNWLNSCAKSTPLAEPGDVNCDGTAGSVDALFILQYDIGTREGFDQCPETRQARTLYVPACDVSGDGICGSVDALFILRCEIGIHNVFCPVSQ